ncbi:AbrB/MazE/SpoVT family DNA-binding domain-containing protein [Aureimonas populi]|uniref:AbrB/MazE/SpoVT family DNA-binding domain-containing protein n=1 Tax=Aureimonas populi TaxID=1701758 RepID=A0ABW5CHX0_9HYPH|nr:AbrB/MazE/SpoVT family DNA-binding domain-containing protein [Aureimonas populi]
MRVTEKGQVTIPKPIRDKLGIKPGSEVEFVSRQHGIVLEKRDDRGDRVDPAEVLLRHVDRHAGRFDLDGLQADDVMRLLRD